MSTFEILIYLACGRNLEMPAPGRALLRPPLPFFVCLSHLSMTMNPTLKTAEPLVSEHADDELWDRTKG